MMPAATRTVIRERINLNRNAGFIRKCEKRRESSEDSLHLWPNGILGFLSRLSLTGESSPFFGQKAAENQQDQQQKKYGGEIN